MKGNQYKQPKKLVKRVTIPFRKSLAMGESAEMVHEIKVSKHECFYVEKISPRFYPGQEETLHIEAFHRVGENGAKSSLVIYPEGGLTYLAGDDDTEIYDCGIRGDMNDAIIIKGTNVNTNDHTYTMKVNVTIAIYEIG